MSKKTSGTRSIIIGIVLLVAGVMLLSSLISYHKEDIGLLHEREGNVANAFGLLGARLAHWFFSALGRIFPWFVGAFLLGWSWNRFARRPVGKLWLQTVFSLLLVFILAVNVALLPGLSLDSALWVAGKAGVGVIYSARSLLGSFGATTVGWGLLIILVFVALRFGLVPGVRYVGVLGRLSAAVTALFGIVREKLAERKKSRVKISSPSQRAEKKPKHSPAPEIQARTPVVQVGPERSVEPPSKAPTISERPKGPRLAPSPPREPVEPVQEVLPGLETDFSLPSLSLLDEPSGPETYMSKEELLECSKQIEGRLANFGVTGKVLEVHPGPVITRFDFEPGAGITVNQIASRAEDLALGLKVSRIRLLTPVPGKAAVGVEIPNAQPSVVYIKELLSSKAFAEQDGRLALALGKDTLGTCFYAELSKMPHLLIAGATGSGKSVCINSIILSLLYRMSPRELNLLMIDPKKLELTAYNGTPHLVAPVVSDAREASKSLRWVVREMERRYHVLAGRAVRNIESFNDKAREEGSELLPFLIVIIDELADLICMLPTEIEEPLARLAQMARAVGIHLILATQRPSVDVITGVIKANFPTRIAFQVASKVDSRTILDMNGAETLLGSGDMLFLPAGRAEPARLHGAYVSEQDVDRVVSYLKEYRWMRKPAPDLTESSLMSENDSEGEDELLQDAIRVVITHRHGSVSLLQRRLKVGDSRAARLIDRLEEIGVVGPADGSKPREVLVNESFLE